MVTAVWFRNCVDLNTLKMVRSWKREVRRRMMSGGRCGWVVCGECVLLCVEGGTCVWVCMGEGV